MTSVIEKLQHVVDLAEEATEGPWRECIEELALIERFGHCNLHGEVARVSKYEDRGFIVDARTSAPAMARALLALWPALERLHEAWDYDAAQEGLGVIGATTALLAAFETAKRELETLVKEKP